MGLAKYTLLIWSFVAALSLVAGCSSAGSIQPAVAGEVSHPGAGEVPLVSIAVDRLVSAAGDFLPSQDGAEFADDLEYSNVSVAGSSAVFDSDWTGSAGLLSDAAYCLYRMEISGSPASVDLELNWAAAAPGTCWLALANWDTLAWDWFSADSASAVRIADAAQYSGLAGRCFAVVVVLSDPAVELASIGIPEDVTGDGYTLFAPLQSTTTYLIDMDGTTVHSWNSAFSPGDSVELTPDGYLMHTCKLSNPDFSAGGSGGRIEQLDWDSNVVWSYELSSGSACSHHDFELLPSGNILLIAWQKHSQAEAIAAGRNPSRIPDGEVWADSIIEIEPTGLSGGNIVWEWYLWDHLVQDHDNGQDNYGVVADHPELVDINFGPPTADWTHVNSVDYNPELDQLVISNHNFSELWVIDHSTTTIEAASHSGGSYGHGGDLLYRWGNPRAYDAGTIGDQLFFGQHDVQWIVDGLDGAGNLLIYNNGMNRPAGDYSNIIEITTPVQPDGSYPMAGDVWEPGSFAWEYMADPPDSFFSNAISGVQRLPGGNTLVCCGNPGWFFEVNPVGEIQWEYQNTVGGGPQGAAVFRCTRYPVDYPGLAQL